MIKDVTDLKVYNEANKLLPKLYDLLNEMPKSELDLEWQIKRAAKSITANIAEGFGKRHFGKEFRRYLLNALGSSDEVISHLRTLSLIKPELSYRTNLPLLLDEYKLLSKRINALHKNWRFDNRPTNTPTH